MREGGRDQAAVPGAREPGKTRRYAFRTLVVRSGDGAGNDEPYQ